MRAFLPPIVLIVCGLAMTACDSFEKSAPPFSQANELVVITVNSPDTFYENSEGGFAGLEFDLASEFARELGMKVSFVVAPQLKQALSSLKKHRGHLAAAGLSVAAGEPWRFRFGPAYQRIQPQVAYNIDYPRPRNIKDLVGKIIEITNGTGHAELLNEAKKKTPGLKWDEVDIASEDLLAKLAEGKIDYVVANSTHINLAKNLYPSLDAAFNLGVETPRVWAFPQDAEPILLEKAQQFFKRIEKDGTLQRLIDRYYGHIRRLEHADVNGILEKMRTVLPGLRIHFHRAEELTGLDWRLIAALAYQESHWDRLATSPTNVRGLMMLTEETADLMKVTDRLDARQSILAGARYLLTLKDMLPPRIVEPDRTWIALAAYNQGYGHIEDGRVLTQRLKLNPDSWVDLKKALPLLSRSEYFENLKHGYARGGEAVILTESVRTYYDILLKYERPHTLGIPASDGIGSLF